MWPAVALTIGIGYVVTLVVCFVHRMPAGSRQLVFALGLSAIVWGPALLAGVAWAGPDFSAGPALVFGAAMTIVQTRIMRGLTWGRRTQLRLLEPATRQLALAEVDRALETARALMKPRRPSHILWLCSGLIRISEFERAVRWFAVLPREGLSTIHAINAANDEAVARMNLGDIAGAREAFDRAPATAGTNAHTVLESTRAMLLALEGEHARALAIVDELAGLDLNRDLSWTLLEVRVVAHAGEGDVDRVVQLLADALDEYGTEFFVSVARKGGAAAALVARLQSSGAYR